MSPTYQPALSTLKGLSDQIGSWSDFCQAVSTQAPTAVRPRPELAGMFDHFPPVPWYPRARIVPITERLSRTLGFATADFYLQDPGSLLAIAAAEFQPGMRVCDLCAAPGGKATALIEMLQCAAGEDLLPSWLLANEPILGRLPPLLFNMARSGNARWMISQLDPDQLATRFPEEFDLVLVDAPCSGQSMVAGSKQSKSAWSEKTVQFNAARQRRILSAAIKLLRPGGQLIYSTCTFSEAENEDQAIWLMQNHDFLPQSIPSLMQFASHVAGCYRLWPHRHPTAGAFVASLRDGRTDRKSTLTFDDQTRPQHIHREWGTLRNVVTLQTNSVSRCVWPADVPAGWLCLSDRFPMHGPEMEFLTGNTWQPAYPLALRTGSDWEPQRRVQLNRQQSLRFCLGEPLQNNAIGWCVVECETSLLPMVLDQTPRVSHRPICWGKGIGERIRPKLPPSLKTIATACRST